MTISEREFIRSQKEQQKKRTRTIVLIILAVILIAVAVFLISRIPKKGSTFAAEFGMSIGDPNAPVKVLEFSNYTCSHCKTFALNQSADFIRDYVDTGMVYYTSYPYPWNEQDITYNASLAAYCAADQDIYFAYKDQIFSKVVGPNDLSDEKILDYAKLAGADINAFETCLNDPLLAERVAETKALADSYNVQGTPSFIVNGTLAYSNNLNQAVEAAIKASGN
jgi:protein-disulfide isomerase